MILLRYSFALKVLPVNHCFVFFSYLSKTIQRYDFLSAIHQFAFNLRAVCILKTCQIIKLCLLWRITLPGRFHSTLTTCKQHLCSQIKPLKNFVIIVHFCFMQVIERWNIVMYSDRKCRACTLPFLERAEANHSKQTNWRERSNLSSMKGWPMSQTQWPMSQTQWPMSQWPMSQTQWPMSQTQWPMSQTQWPMSQTQWPMSQTQWPMSQTQWPMSQTQWPENYFRFQLTMSSDTHTPAPLHSMQQRNTLVYVSLQIDIIRMRR